MEKRRLGNSDLEVSRICVGCLGFGDPARRAWTIDEPASRVIIRDALDCGINFFDTANSYLYGESERILGAAIADFASRHEVVIATKVGLPVGDAHSDRGLSRAHILAQVDASLARLRTDYIDLYQIHRWDYDTPIEETLATLGELVTAGKVRHLGASSMFAWQFVQADCLARSRGLAGFASMQPQYNLAYREEERETLPFCVAQGVGVIPWSPLARGFLSGSRARGAAPATVRAQTDELERRRYHGDSDFAVLDAVCAVAASRGVSPAQIALAWLLGKPAVTAPIVGVTRDLHLRDAIGALAVRLDADEIGALEAPYRPKPVNDHD